MKKILLAFCAFALLCSCYEDKTKEAEIMRTLTIETPGLALSEEGYIMVANGEQLVINPELQLKGIEEQDLTYSWQRNIATQRTQTLMSEMSTEKNLDYTVSWAPDVQPYVMALLITDTQTGVVYTKQFKVIVSSSAGDGLIVADSKDGVGSDLSLVRSKNLSNGYSAETIYKRDRYTLNNEGATYDGIIKGVSYAVQNQGSTTYLLYVFSDKTASTLDAGTYALKQDFNSLFMMAPGSVSGDVTFYPSATATYMSIGQELYKMGRIASEQQFGDPMTYVSPNLTTPKKHANKYVVTGMYNSDYTSFFDEVTGDFFFCTGFSQYNLVAPVQASSANSFSPSGLAGYKEFGSFFGNASHYFHLLQATDNTVALYELSGGGTFEAVAKYDLGNCPDIKNYKTLDGCNTRSVFYYSTGKEVYKAVYTGGNVTATKAYTPASGEEVTCVKVFHEAWAYTSSAPEQGQGTAMQQNDNQLLVATWNASSNTGKIYILPIEGNDGTLGNAVETLDGFGKVSAMGFQGKQ